VGLDEHMFDPIIRVAAGVICLLAISSGWAAKVLTALDEFCVFVLLCALAGKK